MLRALVIAALPLLAALAAAPAYAQDAGGGAGTPPDAGGGTPPQPPADPAPPNPAPAPSPAPAPDPPASQPVDQAPPADKPPATDPGSSQPTPSPADSSSDPGHKQPARPSGDEFTTSTAGPNPSAAPTSSSGSSTDLGASKNGYSDTWLGQDTFVVGKAATKEHRGAPSVRRRFAGLFILGATTRTSRIEAKARRAHETAQVSALGSGPPGSGNPLPSQNPFFNLLSGTSGIGAGFVLAGMLAVLGAAFVLPRDRLKAFRTPTVVWSPLAYVPPIELPG